MFAAYNSPVLRDVNELHTGVGANQSRRSVTSQPLPDSCCCPSNRHAVSEAVGGREDWYQASNIVRLANCYTCVLCRCNIKMLQRSGLSIDRLHFTVLIMGRLLAKPLDWYKLTPSLTSQSRCCVKVFRSSLFCTVHRVAIYVSCRWDVLTIIQNKKNKLSRTDAHYRRFVPLFDIIITWPGDSRSGIVLCRQCLLRWLQLCSFVCYGKSVTAVVMKRSDWLMSNEAPWRWILDVVAPSSCSWLRTRFAVSAPLVRPMFSAHSLCVHTSLWRRRRLNVTRRQIWISCFAAPGILRTVDTLFNFNALIGTGNYIATAQALLAVPNVTAHSSTASVPITVWSVALSI